jgi:hypothetical protein
VSETVTIEGRFNGPEGSGNGGYTCGLLARELDGEAEVTLRRPPPLDRPLALVREERRICLFDGDLLVAECNAGRVELDPPAPPSFAEAEAAARRYPGFVSHAFPTCFVCGPERSDGLRIFAGPLESREVVASPWIPAVSLGDADGRVPEELVWAALDCPGAFAVGFLERGETVLGRMAARIDACPQVGGRHVVVAWPLGADGRKLYAGTALFTDRGELLGIARQTWIAPRA